MASHKYECLGTLPLEFPDGQQVECGEVFERDFEKTTGVEHERWLASLGIIRRADVDVPKTPARPPVVPTKEK